jgi:GNAT superfamily N-acetyltransferase
MHMENQETEFAIRKVVAGNFDEFLGLIDKLAEFEKLTPPDEEAKTRLRVDCLSDKPKYEAFVGTIRGKCIAYVIYFFTYSSFCALPTLFLEDIFVLEEYRKRGVGKKMFDHCKEIAKSRGCGRIELSVLTWNKDAQRFYEKNKAERLSWFFYRLDRENF